MGWTDCFPGGLVCKDFNPQVIGAVSHGTEIKM